MTYLDFLATAKQIVEAEKALYPLCDDALAFDVGGGSSDTDTKFARQGTQQSTMSYTMPAFLSDLVTKIAQSSATPAGIGDKEAGLFSSLMSQTPSQMQGYSALNNNMGISPTGFTGTDVLSKIMARDPFSQAYEQNTQAAFEQRASDAMSQVASGPDAVRGGTARTGIAQGIMADRLAQDRGREVREAQMQDASLGSNAANMWNSIEQARRGTQLQSQQQLQQGVNAQADQGLQAAKTLEQSRLTNMGTLQLASDLLGTKHGNQTDDLKGSGSQTVDSFNWGVNLLGGCCFIFLEVLNGKLPWYIDKARHDYYTPRRRRGYKWMSSWLVPLMRRSRLARRLTNWIIVQPFLRFGAWLYNDESGSPYGVLLTPYCWMWLLLWDAIGLTQKEKAYA